MRTLVPRDGEIVWRPPADLRDSCGLAVYQRWLQRERGLTFADYRSLWRWSVDQLDAFWSSVWEFEQVTATGAADRVLARETMPGASWFPDVHLNYAEHLFRHATDTRPALLYVREDGATEMSWTELRRQAAALSAHLRSIGVQPGDRVVAFLGNGPEAVIGLIATAAVGAVWSVCAPDFGVLGVQSRFAQLEPKVLIATEGYRFAGRTYQRRDAVSELVAALPSLESVVWVPALDGPPPRCDVPSVTWAEATAGEPELTFERGPFDHPLWVLFSSGTTGTPKGIVHGHGGILVEHLKNLHLHFDLRSDDRFLFVGSTSWMVFNLLVSGLLFGATVVLLDGSPTFPDLGELWRLAAEHRVTILGVGAGYLQACLKADITPSAEHDLSALRQVASTGSPLPATGFGWVRDQVGPDVWLSSGSGGTDVCSAFVAGCPLLPVRAGRMQAPCLGVAVEAWDQSGQPVVGQTGELVIRRPMPSMPLRFWNDPGGERLRTTYYDVYPGAWRHGDFIEFDDDLSSSISGRSDATLNRKGIRMGAGDIYAAVEPLAVAREALVVGAELGDDYYMPLFVDLADGADPDDARRQIVAAIKHALSPRHVPDEIVFVPGIPHTRTGKKLEIPIKRLLQGELLTTAMDPGSVDDPSVLSFYAEFARRRRSDCEKK